MKKESSTVFRLTIFITAILALSLVVGFSNVLDLKNSAEELNTSYRKYVIDPSASLNRVIFAAGRVLAGDGKPGETQKEALDRKTAACEGLLSHADYVKKIDAGFLTKMLGNDPLLLVPRIIASNEAYQNRLITLHALLDSVNTANSAKERSEQLDSFRSETEKFIPLLESRSMLLIQLEDYLFTVYKEGSAHLLQHSMQMVAIFTALLLVLAIFVGLYFRAALLAQAELTEHRNHLSAMVEKRTAELTAVNQKLQDTVGEKETLLKEVYHRIKNNLNMVNALISMEKERSPEETRRGYEALESRVSAIAVIHQKLYQSEDLTNIGLEEYLGDLALGLVRSLCADPHAVRIECTAPEIRLPAESIIPLGLIVTEILTNSLKHGFRNRPNGVLSIQGRREHSGFILSVADNGENPKNEDAIRNSPSLGTLLIQELCNQLNGTMELFLGNGTKYVFRFPDL